MNELDSFLSSYGLRYEFKSMEIARNDALEKNVEVERKGLGTPATRAGIIENLIF